jgi:hypothetical protein
VRDLKPSAWSSFSGAVGVSGDWAEQGRPLTHVIKTNKEREALKRRSIYLF